YLRTRNPFFVSWAEYALRILMVLCALLIMAVLSQHLVVGNRFTRLAGEISSEMFLLHGFVIEMAERHTDLCQSWPGVFVLMVYALTFAFGLILHLLLKALYHLFEF
ncbi:MAG: hypothetical protein IJU95_05475, partial [Treponema sp.]|nr:hypothetical protein [Treponema sp.]